MMRLPATDLVAVNEKHMKQIIDTIRSALRRTSPELSKDIFEDGITLTGGAAMTGLLCQRIAEVTGLSAEIAEGPLDCVARGLGRIMDNGR
jgi:rod shape-determining protein MreB